MPYLSQGFQPIAPNGEAARVFPFQPNWARKPVERWEWKTDVLTAFDGTEQRLALRDLPRREFEFDVFAPRNDRTAIENLVWSHRNRVWLVPAWWMARPLAVEAPAGSDFIEFPSADRDGNPFSLIEYREGMCGVLWLGPNNFEAVPINGVTFNRYASLESPVAKGYPVGALFIPAYWARLNDSQPLTRVTGNFTTTTALFNLLPQTINYVGAYDITYRNWPVWEFQTQWADGLQAGYEGKYSELSNGVSDTFIDYEAPRPSGTQEFKVWLNGYVALRDFRRFLCYCRGRLAPFWMPSGMRDFEMRGVIQPGDTTLAVQDTGYSDLIDQGEGRRDVRIAVNAETVVYRRIIQSTLNPNGEVLQLDGPVVSSGFTGRIDSAPLISLMAPARLDQDRTEIALMTAQAGLSTGMIRTLSHGV